MKKNEKINCYGIPFTFRINMSSTPASVAKFEILPSGILYPQNDEALELYKKNNFSVSNPPVISSMVPQQPHVINENKPVADLVAVLVPPRTFSITSILMRVLAIIVLLFLLLTILILFILLIIS